uniref:CSON013051 protein n=1 Tax=Culicoides sonorensis TaxID=179676 RepID=A0A336MB71_CULSO
MAQAKVRKCCVPSCSNTHETCSSFFRFPNDQRDKKRWKNAIGFPADFEPDINTFVCIKHFMERDVAQKADRKTGQKARLKILSTPRLHLEPIKEEKKTEESDEAKTETAKNSAPIISEETKTVETNGTVDEPKKVDLTLGGLLKELQERESQNFNGKRKRAKLSLVLPMLESVDIYSSDSDCDYQISLNIKKIPRQCHKKVKNDLIANTSSNNLTLNTNSVEDKNVMEKTPEKLKPIAESINPPSEPVIRQPELHLGDDFEDALTPTVIPKQPPRCITAKNSSPNMHPKKRNYRPSTNENSKLSTAVNRATNLILPPKKNYSNIMVASISADGTIVEEMEELVTTPERSSAISQIQVNASQDDLSQLIEVDFSGTIEDPTPVTNNLPPAELLQDTDQGQDTDDETNDGLVRICYECSECKEMFLSKKKTIRHMKQAHNISVSTINGLKGCTKQYPYKNFRMVNGLRAFTCSICLMLYYNVQSLKKHQVLMHAQMLDLEEVPLQQSPPSVNSNIHVCPVCQKSFLEAENLRSHKLLHGNRKSDEIAVYKCEECGLGFEYEAALTRHTIEHHQTLKLYSCEYCNDAFATGADLIEHIQNHLMNKDQTLQTDNDDSAKLSELVLVCPEDNCNMQFKDSKDYYSHILYTHRKVYQDDPKFIEYIQLVDPDTLNEKKTKSPGTQTKFNCRICDRKFSHYSFLKAHEAGKNKFKYECSECNEKTPSKVCLVRHYNVRHDKNIERLHFCTDCPKSFPKKTELLTHIATHRTDGQSTIHHCNLDGCDRIFADQTTYHFHLSRLHPNAKNVGALVCHYENCNQRFRHETLLKQHINDEHYNKISQPKNLNVGTFSVENTSSSTTKEQNIFFGHSDKYPENGSIDLNIPDTLMPEVCLNDVCNEVTIYTDF